MRTDIADHLAAFARRALELDTARKPARETARGALTGVLEEAVLVDWLDNVSDGAFERSDKPGGGVGEMLDSQERARDGIFFTPESIAEAMAEVVDIRRGQVVVDPAAGAGHLLEAAGRRHPSARLVGIEKHAHLAVAAAIRIAAVRRRQGSEAPSEDRVYVGDGLARDERWADLEGRAGAVLANPPYVGEKGRRQLFRRLEQRHSHLSRYFGPRLDLQYLFFHRSASLLAEGARLVLLTSAYWLTATGAATVRRDLAERMSPELFVRLDETGVFSDAPGQHTLLSVLRRGDCDRPARALALEEAPRDWSGLVAGLLDDATIRGATITPQRRFGAGNWTPFVDRTTRSWGESWRLEGTPLAQLADDRQGFVSGADRFHGRHRAHYDEQSDTPEPGEPIFLFERGEVPGELAALGPTVLRPLLRASELAPNAVVVEPPDDACALYVDGEVSRDNEEILERHLGRFRPILARRREVKRGTMPWYRLHWPRDRREQTGPKLVVPRRASHPRFALDLSASCVSSDCTYLVAPDDVERPLTYLIRLMVALNSDEVARYLREFGKLKGRQLEFYSEPLRNLPLPLRSSRGRLLFDANMLGGERTRALRATADTLCEQVRA